MSPRDTVQEFLKLITEIRSTVYTTLQTIHLVTIVLSYMNFLLNIFLKDKT